MNKISLLFVVMLGSVVLTHAQSVSPSVIGAHGTQTDLGSVQVATTLGEVRTATATNVTQGFHQPWITVVPTDVDVPEGVEVNIYPNPTTDILNINVIGQDENLSARMFDMHGREVANVQWNGRAAASMNVGHLAVGTYLLELYLSSSGKRSTYTIIRSN